MWYPRIRLAERASHVLAAVKTSARLEPCDGKLLRQIGERSQGRGRGALCDLMVDESACLAVRGHETTTNRF